MGGATEQWARFDHVKGGNKMVISFLDISYKYNVENKKKLIECLHWCKKIDNSYLSAAGRI